MYFNADLTLLAWESCSYEDSERASQEGLGMVPGAIWGSDPQVGGGGVGGSGWLGAGASGIGGL